MFEGKARAEAGEAAFRSSTLGRLLALPTNMTILEELARDKHSSLSQKFKNYNPIKFYKIGRWSLIF
jgi:hypothetical protein